MVKITEAMPDKNIRSNPEAPPITACIEEDTEYDNNSGKCATSAPRITPKTPKENAYKQGEWVSLSLFDTLITAAMNGGNNHKGNGAIIPFSRTGVVIKNAMKETGIRPNNKNCQFAFDLYNKLMLIRTGKTNPIG